MIRVFGGFGVPCEGGVFWGWGVWSSVEGRGCGGSEALNPSMGVRISPGPSWPKRVDRSMHLLRIFAYPQFLL